AYGAGDRSRRLRCAGGSGGRRREDRQRTGGFLATPDLHSSHQSTRVRRNRCSEYEGPAISSHRLAQFEADPPASHVSAGKFSGNVYENQTLGFAYRIPAGWTLQPDGAVQPAVERSHRRNYDDPWLGPGERELMKVCNRNLF